MFCSYCGLLDPEGVPICWRGQAQQGVIFPRLTGVIGSTENCTCLHAAEGGADQCDTQPLDFVCPGGVGDGSTCRTVNERARAFVPPGVLRWVDPPRGSRRLCTDDHRNVLVPPEVGSLYKVDVHGWPAQPVRLAPVRLASRRSAPVRSALVMVLSGCGSLSLCELVCQVHAEQLGCSNACPGARRTALPGGMADAGGHDLDYDYRI